jgi:two-component system phosphate regulon sensor histidine kinase PhoR
MTNVIIRRIILLGAFAILSLLSVQTYWVLRTWNLTEKAFNRKVTQALIEAANDLRKHYKFELPPAKLITQPSSNYYVVNINNLFDAPTLEYYLQKAFESQGMREDFEYGIFDCSSNQMITGRRIKYEKKTLPTVLDKLDKPLPTHADSDFIYYFGVRFPNKSANIISEMWIVVAFTALILITVAFFIYSIFIILRQRQLSELQRDFINNMTHEFKTPISTINISTDVFLKNPRIQEDPRLSRYASIIKEQALRLNNQVENVLQYAQLERGAFKLNLEETNLGELIDHISPSLELKASEKNGHIHIKNRAPQATVLADRLHLSNILHNLVDNAVKYTPNKPEIAIDIQQTDQTVILSVHDNGLGIPKEHQRRVFDKFHRVPTGNIHNVKGFGLGLFYVKKMCVEHHWKIQLESEPGKGTRIQIKMPAAKQQPSASPV